MQIIVKVPVEGTHRYEDAPDEVSYLRFDHRHIFLCELHFDVTHADRDKEFFIMQHKIKRYLVERYWEDEWKLCNFGPMSCEMIARELKVEFDCSKVIVWEDQENGGVV